MIGSTRLNHYKIESEPGKGSMGVVYRAHDTLLNCAVAIKFLNTAGVGIEGKSRLIREARAAQLFGAVWVQYEDGDQYLAEAGHPDYEARIAEIRSAVGDAAFDAVFQKGQAMKIKDVLAFALEEIQ